MADSVEVDAPPTTTAEFDRQAAGVRLLSAVAPPRTTSEEDRRTAGQRRVNILWELTQAALTIMIASAVIYLAVQGKESKTLELAFMAIVTMYFTRTNHTKTGGVGGSDVTTGR